MSILIVIFFNQLFFKFIDGFREVRYSSGSGVANAGINRKDRRDSHNKNKPGDMYGHENSAGKDGSGNNTIKGQRQNRSHHHHHHQQQQQNYGNKDAGSVANNYQSSAAGMTRHRSPK